MFRQVYAQLSIFEGLDRNQLDQLSPFFTECRFPKDYMIFEQGQPADHLFILLEGEVVIKYKPYDGPILTVAHIEPGGVFGWSAALRREVYTSAAVSMNASLVYRIRGASLIAICDQYPDTGKIFLERLASVIAKRLQSTHTHILGMLTEGMDSKSKNPRRSSRNDRRK